MQIVSFQIFSYQIVGYKIFGLPNCQVTKLLVTKMLINSYQKSADRTQFCLKTKLLYESKFTQILATKLSTFLWFYRVARF